MATDTTERVPVAIKPVSGWSNHAFLGHDRAPIVVLTIRAALFDLVRP